MISLTGVAMTAVLCDLRFARIPNAAIAAGLAMGLTYQLFAEGILGAILFAGGACLPVLVLGALYYFRMMGAGDIKLLCVAGGFFGPGGAFRCIACSVAAAAVFSLFLMFRRGMLRRRLAYFRDYLRTFLRTGVWQPYLEGVEESAKFCFSVPVLIGILCCL